MFFPHPQRFVGTSQPPNESRQKSSRHRVLLARHKGRAVPEAAQVRGDPAAVVTGHLKKGIPSGKPTKNVNKNMENHHVQWVKLWKITMFNG